MENRNYANQEDALQNEWQMNVEPETLYAADDDDKDTEEDAGEWGDVDPQGNDGLGTGNEPSAPGSAV